MNILNFAHNGVHHSSEVESAAHQSSSGIIWVIAGSMLVAAVLYAVIRLLSSRQPQEQENKQEKTFDR